MNCYKCGEKLKESYQFCPFCGVERPDRKDGLVQCQLCKRSFVPQGFKNHIINKAKAELFKRSKDKPHYEYLQKTK